MSNEGITFRESSGNVFADLGLDDADGLMAKAELALAIRRRIEEMGLTQTQAAEIMGTTQARVSELYNAKVMKMTYDRLLGFLNALQCDAYINVTAIGTDVVSGRGKTLVREYVGQTYTTQNGGTVEIEIHSGKVQWTERLGSHASPHTYTFDRKKALEIKDAFTKRTQSFLDGSHTVLFGTEMRDAAHLNACDCGYLAALLNEAASVL